MLIGILIIAFSCNNLCFSYAVDKIHTTSKSLESAEAAGAP